MRAAQDTAVAGRDALVHEKTQLKIDNQALARDKAFLELDKSALMAENKAWQERQQAAKGHIDVLVGEGAARRAVYERHLANMTTYHVKALSNQNAHQVQLELLVH